MLEKWLLVFDLDGTLFNTDHKISDRAIAALHGVAELGHSIVISTGRSSYSAVPRLSKIPTVSRLLCSNGAYEYDYRNQVVIWSNMLSASISVELQRTIQGVLPEASFGWESASGINYEQKFEEEAGGAQTLEQGGTRELLGHSGIFKMFVRTPDQSGAELSRTLQTVLGSDFEVSSSGVPFVEITAAGTDKGTALAKIARDLGFESSQCIAFGDNLNDIPMLRWAGQSVAMGNAIAEVHAIATARAECNAEDGVARFLESRFLVDDQRYVD